MKSGTSSAFVVCELGNFTQHILADLTVIGLTLALREAVKLHVPDLGVPALAGMEEQVRRVVESERPAAPTDLERVAGASVLTSQLTNAMKADGCPLSA